MTDEKLISEHTHTHTHKHPHIHTYTHTYTLMSETRGEHAGRWFQKQTTTVSVTGKDKPWFSHLPQNKNASCKQQRCGQSKLCIYIYIYHINI